MKKILLVLFLVLFATSAYGAVDDIKCTGSTVTLTVGEPGLIITFNTVVNKILVVNEDTVYPVHVTYTGLGWTNTHRYITPTSVTQSTTGAAKIEPSASLSIDFETDMIGFYAEDEGHVVSYFVTTRLSTQP